MVPFVDMVLHSQMPIRHKEFMEKLTRTHPDHLVCKGNHTDYHRIPRLIRKSQEGRSRSSLLLSKYHRMEMALFSHAQLLIQRVHLLFSSYMDWRFSGLWIVSRTALLKVAHLLYFGSFCLLKLFFFQLHKVRLQTHSYLAFFFRQN